MKDSKWLSQQHKIDNIVAYLSEEGGSSAQMRKVISWPRVLFHSRFLHNTIEFARSAVLPLQKDLPGIRNLNDEEGMREEQISRVKGYKVLWRFIFSEEGGFYPLFINYLFPETTRISLKLHVYIDKELGLNFFTEFKFRIVNKFFVSYISDIKYKLF
jgi:hypothetical protein